MNSQLPPRNGAILIRSAASGRGGIGLIVGSAAVLAFVVFVILPWPMGMRAEQLFRQRIADARQRGADVQIASYDRGWFSSSATISIQYKGHQLTFASNISHGPFVLWGKNASVYPVLAASTTILDLPPELKTFFSDSRTPVAEARTVIDLSGRSNVHLDVSSFRLQTPSQQGLSSFAFSGGECDIQASQHHALGSCLPMGWKGQTGDRISNVNVGKIEFDGETAEDEPSLGLRDFTGTIAEISFSGSGHTPGGSSIPVELHIGDVRLHDRTWRDGGSVRAEWQMASPRVQVLGSSAIAIDATFGTANVNPRVFLDWSRANNAVFASAKGRDEQAKLFNEKLLGLFAALAKDKPQFTADVNVSGNFGAVTAKLEADLKPGMATDRTLINATASPETLKLVADRYLHVLGEVELPATMRQWLRDPKTGSNLVDEGYFTAVGDSLTGNVTYADGHLSINGRQAF
jgi:uncharacterized protein YdgA (DUF945 family)